MVKKIQNHFSLSFLLLLHIFSYADQPNTVVATINVGITPAGIAITPDNRVAYVANDNGYELVGEDTVSVLNLKTNLPEKTISDPSFNQPYSVTINKAGTKVYVTNSNGSTVTIIDVASNEVIGVIDGFDGPLGMVIAPNGKKGYVINYGGPDGVGSGNGNTMRVVDLKTNKIVGPAIVVGQAPAALVIAPDGEFVYVVNYVDGNPGTGTMSVVQTKNNEVVATIPGFFGPFEIAITSDGRFAYVTNFGSNNFTPIGTTVTVVNLRKNIITATVDLGIQPSGIAVTPDDRFVYVTNYNTLYAGSNFTNLTPGQGTVNIIDTYTNTVIPPTIAVGQGPHAVAISSDGKFAYTSNHTANTLSVIALACSNNCEMDCNRAL